MKFRLPQSGGFTLVELIVAVAISGVLLTGAIAAYKGLGQRQNVKQTGISFQTNLKSYQQKALAGDKPADCSGGSDVLTGYQISYVSPGAYTVQAICEVSEPAAVTVTLPGEVEFSAPFTDIFFPVLSANLSGAQTIDLTKDGSVYRVTVESSGVIYGQTVSL